jgi:hypothetical protein
MSRTLEQENVRCHAACGYFVKKVRELAAALQQAKAEGAKHSK